MKTFVVVEVENGEVKQEFIEGDSSTLRLIASSIIMKVSKQEEKNPMTVVRELNSDLMLLATVELMETLEKVEEIKKKRKMGGKNED